MVYNLILISISALERRSALESIYELEKIGDT